MELAALKGTEKQINWAKVIRKDRLKVWQGTDPDSFQGVESVLAQQSASSWWITSRDKSLKDVSPQLLGAAEPQTPRKRPAPTAPMKPANKGVYEEVWETVVTTSGFRRSGPTRDLVTGEIVSDATLPF